MKRSTILANLLFFVFFIFFCLPCHVKADDAIPDPNQKTSIVEVQVLSISKEEGTVSSGTNLKVPLHTFTVKIISGENSGSTVQITNDLTRTYVGDKFFAEHIIDISTGKDSYIFVEHSRLNILLGLFLLFIITLALFGGWQGLRALITLLGSIGLIIYILIPGITHGISPILLSIGVASLIIIVGSYITHGFNKTTTSAIIGMLVTILITGYIANFVTHAAQLGGITSDTDAYLMTAMNGTLDFQGLLLGGILIGLLGVLYDIAISQAISVEELIRANQDMSVQMLYQRAIRIGREHIGALVNTLAIAYVGVSLPLLLYFFIGPVGPVAPVIYTINHELFATEIIRTLVGSIGLILAVPITTFITISFLKKGDSFSFWKNEVGEILKIKK